MASNSSSDINVWGIKTLRERTGASLSEAKEAWKESQGDLIEAVKILEKRPPKSYTMVDSYSYVVKNSLSEHGTALNNWRSSFSTLPPGEVDGLEKQALEKLTAEENRRQAAAEEAIANKAAAAYRRGSDLVKRADFKAAISEFEEALKLAPGNDTYQDALALAKANLLRQIKWNKKIARNSLIGRIAGIVIGAVLAFVTIKILLINSDEVGIGIGLVFALLFLAFFGVTLALLGIITNLIEYGYIVGGIVGIAGAIVVAFSGNTRMGIGTTIFMVIVFAIIGAIIGLAAKYFTILMRKHWVVSLLAAVALAIGVVAYGPAEIFASASPPAAVEASAPQIVRATVTSANANFRSAPGTNSTVLKTLKRGDVLTVTGDTANGWTPVEHDGVPGYISADLISIDGGE